MTNQPGSSRTATAAVVAFEVIEFDQIKRSS
jgi:hypothetical protein